MAKFFIDRPIVAMVISILTVIIGLVAIAQLPIAQYPNIAPPEMLLTANYPGADAVTLEQSVATPIEQQMSGVDNMLYMYSTSQTSGTEMNLRVSFDITTDPNIDQVLVNMRYSQASSQLPQDVVNQGVTVKKSVLSPLALFILHSPKGTYDELFLSNYAYVNLNDPMTRVPGIGQVTVFGANKYAIRFWVNPDTLAKLDITVNEIVRAMRRAGWRASRTSRTSWSGRLPTDPSCGCETWRASSWASSPTTATPASTGAPRRASPSTSCPAPTRSRP